MLRLLREDLGTKTFKAENRRFRDAGRLLAASRDAEVKIQTLAALERRFGGELPLAPSRAWDQLLRAERDAAAAAVEADGAAGVGAAIELIEVGGARIPEWPLRHDSWRLIEPGLDRAYRDGRAALRAIRADRDGDDAVHEFRKRAKDLWYLLRLLAGAWPGLLDPSAEQLHELTEMLGDHHDLAVLGEDLDARVGAVAERDAIGILIERRQEELLEAAIELGRRIYSEKPKRFRRRVRGYWRIWRD